MARTDKLAQNRRMVTATLGARPGADRRSLVGSCVTRGEGSRMPRMAHANPQDFGEGRAMRRVAIHPDA